MKYSNTFLILFSDLLLIINNTITLFSLLQIYDSSITREDNIALQDAFESSVIFLLLSKFDNHQVCVCVHVCVPVCVYVCACVCVLRFFFHFLDNSYLFPIQLHISFNLFPNMTITMFLFHL